MELFNRVTGETLPVDPLERRISYMQKRVHAWERMLNPYLSRVGVPGGGVKLVYLGLTYRPGEVWHPLDISEFIVTVRSHLGDRLMGYCWVAEVQPQRGVIHYNVFLLVPMSADVPKPDKAGWWVHGSTFREDRERGTAQYAASAYGAKRAQKEGLPAGAHMFCVWIRSDLLSWEQRFEWWWSSKPRWLLEAWIFSGYAMGRDSVFPEYRRGEGWLIPGGEPFYFNSPWELKY